MAIVALGTFDGLHGGHQALFDVLREEAQKRGEEAIIHTFRNHPRTVFAKAPGLLMRDETRLSMLKETGCRVVADEFTKEYAALSPEAFVHSLMERLDMRVAVTGFNYSFGLGGAGDTSMLARLGEACGFAAITVPPKMYEGAPISSTRIRQAVENGDMRTAAAMLTRPYFIGGEVVGNREIGRTLGFPTANITWQPQQLLPRPGVYATMAQIEGRSYKAVTNVGDNPTVNGAKTTIETHLLGENVNLYGKLLTVHFMEYLRGEIRFASTQELKGQIARDKEAAARILAEN